MTEKDLINAAIRSNAGAWFESGHAKIWAKDRRLGLVSPRLNYLQAKIQKTVSRFERLDMPCRIIGLKPRARGSTTFFCCQSYTAMRRMSTSSIFIGGQSDQTVGGWNMIKVFKNNDSFNWGNTGDVNEKGATFSNGSRAKKETAKDVQAGIGDTYGCLHATEVARWSQYGVSNASAVMINILKAIPLLPETYIFLESTAETAGGDYYNRWLGAVDSEDFLNGDKDIEYGGYARCFASWFQFDESALRLTDEQKGHVQATLDANEEWIGERELLELYSHTDENGELHLGETVTEFDAWEQLSWRRYAIREECDRDVRIFDRDFPHSWQSAFMKSGKMRFNSTGVSVLRKRLEKAPVAMHGLIEEPDKGRVAWRNTDQNECKFTIWERPIPGCRYILPVDPMTGASQAVGLDPDKHSAPILRAGYWNAKGIWIRKAVVARVVPCRWEIDTLEDAVWRLSRYYGSRSSCMIVVEVNLDRGLIELLKLRGANLYAREVFNKREVKTTTALGWKTDTNSREKLITTLAASIREWDTPGNGIDIWCPHAIAQLENFILKETGRSEAGQGYHDDDVVAIAMGDELIEHATVYVPERSFFGPPDEMRGAGGQVVTSQYS